MWRVFWTWGVLGLGGALLWGQVWLESQEQLRMAQMLESAGDYAGAVRIYERLCRLYPDSVSYFLGLSRALARLQQEKEALERLRKFTERHPHSAALALVGELYWRVQQPDSARWAWQEALRRAPQDPQSYRAVAFAQAEVQLFDEAIRTLQQGRLRLRSDTVFADELSRWYVRIGDVERGVTETLRLLSQWKELQGVQNRLAVYLALPEAISRARSVIERRASEYRQDTLLQYLFVWFLEEIKEFRAALEQVRRLDELYQRGGMELLRFADAARQSEEFALALEAYQEVLKRHPARELRLRALYGSLQAAEQLVRGGVQDIPWQRIRREYEELVRQADTLLLSAEVLYSLGIFLQDVAQDWVAAGESFQRLLRDFPQTRWAAWALVHLAQLALRQDAFEQAGKYLQQAMGYDTLVPDAVEQARLWRAEMEFFRGNWDSARALYAAVAIQTGSPVANDALQRLLLFESVGDSALLYRFAQAERAFFQRRFARAQAEYRAVAEREGVPEQVRELALLRAAEAAYAQGAWEQVQQFLTRLLSEGDDVLYGDRALLLLGDVLERQQRYAEAVSVYQRFLVRYPGSIYEREVARRMQRLREKPGL